MVPYVQGRAGAKGKGHVMTRRRYRAQRIVTVDQRFASGLEEYRRITGATWAEISNRMPTDSRGQKPTKALLQNVVSRTKLGAESVGVAEGVYKEVRRMLSTKKIFCPEPMPVHHPHNGRAAVDRKPAPITEDVDDRLLNALASLRNDDKRIALILLERLATD